MITMSPQLWSKLNQINRHWNERIEYQPDFEHYGKLEYWYIPQDGLGDCEDFALAKKRSLENQGIKSCLATCYVETGEYHAVLVVHADTGSYVLDNRYDQVMSWDRLPYEWEKMQAEDGHWYAIL